MSLVGQKTDIASPSLRCQRVGEISAALGQFAGAELAGELVEDAVDDAGLVALVAAMHKLLTILNAMLRSGRTWQPNGQPQT